jgi:hypothetical protein
MKEDVMDDKGKTGGSDRRQVAKSQQYEVSYFAKKHRISAADARAILQEAGRSREKANELAGRKH